MLDRRKLGFVLWPLSFLYRIVVTIRNFLFDIGVLRSVKFDIATISVGNITVGGTGKTPHIEYLVKLLAKRFNLVVLSRGYKRSSKGFQIAEDSSLAKEIGDEPKQIKQKFPNVTVVVDADRREGIRKIQAIGDATDKPYDLVLLDDAYQHRHVIPGLSILLIDYNRPIDEDRMLPVGNLREPEFSKHRANFIIVSKCPQNLKPIECRLLAHRFKVYPHQKLYFTTLIYGEPVKLYPPFDSTKVESLKQTSVLIVSGIAEPSLLVNHFTDMAKDVNVLAFDDHHYYTENDVSKIKRAFDAIETDNKIILTTEKDATRMRELDLFEQELGEVMFYIPVEVDFLYDGKEQFDEKIMNYVKRNKRNSKLLKKQV